MTKTKPNAVKRAPAHAAVKSTVHRVNDAQPAHAIIAKCGGVRALARAIGVSPAAVTRWQTPRTEGDTNGCDGVIPEFRRAAVIAAARALRKRVTKAEFLKS